MWENGARKGVGLNAIGRKSRWRRGGTRPLAEVAAQARGPVVQPQLNEGVQQVPVQVRQLLAGAHLLQVVGGDHKQVAQGVERVKELQY